MYQIKNVFSKTGVILGRPNISSPHGTAYMRQWIGSALACRQFGAKPLFNPMLDYCQLEP